MRTAFFAALLSVVLTLGLAAQSSPNLSFRGPERPLHATVTAAPSELGVTPGVKAMLFIDVAPKANIHVYAPGAKDFIAIAVKFEPQASLKLGKLAYPKSEVMTFADEKVPVFQKPFRLTQEITLRGPLQPGTAVPVKATVDYQACDDRVCYAPESVPVIWTLKVAP